MLPLFSSLVFTMAGVGIYADSNRSLRSDVAALAHGAAYVALGGMLGFALVLGVFALVLPFGF